MAETRRVDGDVRKFYLGIAITSIVFFGPLFVWTGFFHGGVNAAFVVCTLVAILMCVGICEYARRRPAGAWLSWGGAMLAATYVFFLLFWVYGIWPHQFLTWADNEMNWRPDRFLIGPTIAPGDQGLFEWILPFSVTYEVIRDIITVTLYVIALGAQIWLWSIWQHRGETVPTHEETSKYGRPLENSPGQPLQKA